MTEIVPPDSWLQRPRRITGDRDPIALFCAVGLSLTMWETIEGGISVAYIGLVDTEPYDDDRYFKTPSFEARYKLVKKAIDININTKDCADFSAFLDLVLKFSPRRHEIAHGRVFNMGEQGYIIGPNNSLARNFVNKTATYQYIAADVNFYAAHFKTLGDHATEFGNVLARRRNNGSTASA
jgi:hypothetical protein